MSETRQITLLVILTLAIAFGGITVINAFSSLEVTPGAVVEKYYAVLHPDGQLQETYTYSFSEQWYRMLYRSWEAPVSTGTYSSPYIKPLDVDAPSGTVSYIKDLHGQVTVLPPWDGNTVIRDTIDTLAEFNEIGCYYGPYFQVGRYTISYQFQLYPPIEYDSSYDHLNLKLANIHIRCGRLGFA